MTLNISQQWVVGVWGRGWIKYFLRVVNRTCKSIKLKFKTSRHVNDLKIIQHEVPSTTQEKEAPTGKKILHFCLYFSYRLSKKLNPT